MTLAILCHYHNGQLKCIKIIKIAIINQTKRNQAHLESEPDDFTKFPVNSYVLVDYEKNALEITYSSRRPFKFVKISGNVHNYTIQSLITNEATDVHVTRLHPFLYDTAETDLRLIANKDQQFVDVE